MKPEIRDLVEAIAVKKPGTVAQHLLAAAESALEEGLAPGSIAADVAERLIQAAKDAPFVRLPR